MKPLTISFIFCLKIFFSGKRHDFKLREESLKIRLFENNTVVISAKLDVAVHARTWIWKGVNFGFLGCMKITSCGGQDVTYKGKIDMKVSFEVLWNEEKKRLGVTIRPVDTQLSDVYVTGCRPPWYLWWVFMLCLVKKLLANLAITFELFTARPCQSLKSNFMAINTQRKIIDAHAPFFLRKCV